MKAKKIINIVFYKYFDNEGEKKQACIFYRDGSASLVSYEEGIDACEEIVKQRKITSKNAFKEMINREIVHVVSGDEFINNFDRYKSHDPLDYEIIDETVEEEMDNVEATTNPVIIKELEEDNIIEKVEKEELDNNDNISKGIVLPEEEEDDEIIDDEKEEIDSEEADATKKQNIVIPMTDEDEEEDYFWNDDYYDDDYCNSEDDNEDEIEETQEFEKQEEEPKGIIGFFKKQIKKIKESKLATRITAIVVTLAIGLGLYSCANRKTAMGMMFNSNLGNNTKTLDDLDIETEDNQTTEKATTNTANVVITNDNSFYDGYNFEQLQEVTNNSTQKRAMKNVKLALETFNGNFADAYVEPGKDIRAALSFEETVALQVAYNNYSKEDIKAIFNGADFNASKYSRAYRDASLQLMGAYAIENSQNPVDMSMLIESDEGKEFYQRYHQMFLAAKEATGEEKLARINEFYKAVREDFPITDDVRTEGIAHADTYSEIMEKDGAVAVTPMIAAAEMLFQNYEHDYTLTDGQIDFLNDIGLCNQVDKKFERIEIITLGMCSEDETNPTYEQYRDAIIKELKEKNIYVIDDMHRELTKLDSFQNAVNWHFKETGEWKYSGGFYEETTSYTETNTWTETETTYREEETRVKKPIPKDEKRKIDKEIEEENKKEKKKAEEEAKKEQERMQKEEDKKAKDLEKEIEKDEKDLQDKIDDANDQIDKNHDDNPTNDKPVNEDDLGHGVDFDDEHSDEHGNLDDSVENITTDPTGDQTGQPLPDPEVTGAEFDAQAPEKEITEPNYEETTTQETVVEEPVQERVVEEPVYEEPVYEEPVVTETPVVQYDEVVLDDGSGYYEEIVDDYVESLADQDAEEEAYEYSL